MNIKIIKYFVLPIIILMSFLACEDKKSSTQEYRKIYLEALNSHDEVVIKEAIKYFDGIIKHGSTNDFPSVYYNKAQLLKKIEEFDEALIILDNLKTPQDYFYRASLLVLLGRIEDAEPLFNTLIEIDNISISEKQINNKRLFLFYDNLILVYILSDRDLTEIINIYRADNRLKSEDISRLNNSISIKKKDLLNGLWP